MRIAYVINSLEGGGAALPVPAIARVLASRGATMAVLALTRRDGRAAAAMTKAGLTLHVRQGGEKDHVRAVGWLDRQITSYAPDLIWTSLTRATLLGQLVGARRGIPVVSWQHNAHLKPANRLLLRATERLSSLWVADSQNVAVLTERRLGVPPARLATWPLFAADVAAPQATPWQPGQPVRLGALGRLHPNKGYDVLIAALARMQADGYRPPAPFELQIGGEGAEREALQSAIQTAGLRNVRLAGFVEHPREFLAGLNLYLQPSRREGLCIAAHEAMQAGLPVIVSSVGEMPNSVQPGVSGLVVAPGCPDALAQALVTMLNWPARLAAMGLRGRANVISRFGGDAFDRAGADVLARAVAFVGAAQSNADTARTTRD